MIFNAAQFQTLTDCPLCAVDMLENIELKETVYLDFHRDKVEGQLRRKVYFGLWFWSYQSMVCWFSSFCACGEADPHDKNMSERKLFMR